MKSKINKMFPFLDQAITAAYNFLFVLVTSFIMPTKEFVIINYIMLMVLLMVNVHNAMVFQPFLKFFFTRISEDINKLALKTLLIINLISILIFAGTFFFLNISLTLFIEAIIWLFILSFYEFNRRISMLREKWDFNFYIGLLLNILTWPTMVYFGFVSAKYTLLFIVSIYLLVTIIFTVKNYKYFWSKLFLGMLHDSDSHRANIFKENKEFYKFGILLLGGSVAFWFISGGYLLYLGQFLTTNETALLRVIQNMLNGIWIILTALDNVILSGSGNRIIRKINSIHFLALVTLFITFYGALIYMVFRFFYDFGNIIYVLSIWLLFYLIMSFAKIYMSFLKFNGESKSVFISQGIGAVIYYLIVTFMNFIGVKLNIINVSLLWIPTSLIILLISIRDLKRIYSGGLYE